MLRYVGQYMYLFLKADRFSWGTVCSQETFLLLGTDNVPNIFLCQMETIVYLMIKSKTFLGAIACTHVIFYLDMFFVIVGMNGNSLLFWFCKCWRLRMLMTVCAHIVKIFIFSSDPMFHKINFGENIFWFGWKAIFLWIFKNLKILFSCSLPMPLITWSCSDLWRRFRNLWLQSWLISVVLPL